MFVEVALKVDDEPILNSSPEHSSLGHSIEGTHIQEEPVSNIKEKIYLGVPISRFPKYY